MKIVKKNKRFAFYCLDTYSMNLFEYFLCYFKYGCFISPRQVVLFREMSETFSFN